MLLKFLVALLSYIIPSDGNTADEYLFFMGFGSIGAFFNAFHEKAFLLQTASGTTLAPSALNAALNLILAGVIGLCFKLAYDYLKIILLRRMARSNNTDLDAAMKAYQQTLEK